MESIPGRRYKFHTPFFDALTYFDVLIEINEPLFLLIKLLAKFVRSLCLVPMQ